MRVAVGVVASAGVGTAARRLCLCVGLGPIRIIYPLCYSC